MMLDARIPHTLLYYPSIKLPTGGWLRQAILYWDEVASIVPRDSEDRPAVPLTSDMEYLQGEGVFRAIDPVRLVHDPQGDANSRNFERELRDIVDSPSYRNGLPPAEESRATSLIHRNKLSAAVEYYLSERRLAENNSQDARWVRCEATTAIVYMALLAKYLADADERGATVPATDRPEYERLMFASRSHDGSLPCLAARLLRALPVPHEDTPLSEILRFRKQRRQELLAFRQVLEEFKRNLVKAQTRSDVQEVCASFGDSVEEGIEGVRRTMRESRVHVVAGSLKALVTTKAPPMWAVAGAVAGAAHGDVRWTLVGFGVGAILSVASEVVRRLSTRSATVRDCSFAYLYHAEADLVNLPFPVPVDARPVESALPERGTSQLVKVDPVALLLHEVHRPLVAFRGALEFLERESREKGYVYRHDYFSDMHSYCEEMRRILSRLQVLQVGPERVYLHARPVSLLRDVLAPVVRGLEPLLRRRGFGSEQIRLSGFDAFPRMYCDVELMRQAVDNLLINAVRYAYRDPAAFQVEVEARRDQKCHRIVFRDWGPGLPEEGDGESLFVLGVRGRRSIQEAAGGAGIGLWVAREIVRRHGGELRIASPRHPTELVIDLPSTLTQRPPAATPNKEE